MNTVGPVPIPSRARDGPVLLDTTRYPAGAAVWMLISSHDVYHLQGDRTVLVLDPDQINPGDRFLLTHVCPPREAS